MSKDIFDLEAFNDQTDTSFDKVMIHSVTPTTDGNRSTVLIPVEKLGKKVGEVEDQKIQITENTGFAQVGQNQKDFNRNVANTVSNQGNEINTLKGINFEMDIPNQKLILRSGNSAILTEISVAFLNDEAKHLEYDGVSSLVLKNEQGEILSTLSVASFINQIGKSLFLDGIELELRDENNNVLSSVTLEINNIAGLSEDLEFLKNNVLNQGERLTTLEGINYVWSPTNRTLTLYDNNGTQLSQVSLVSLDNEGTDIRYNASTLSLELYNADNELLDSIPVSSFIGSVGTQLQLNSNQLQLKDSQGNVLSTVSFAVSNIQGLQTALDGKLNIPTMTNNYYGLWDDVNKKFINGNLYKDNNKNAVGVGSYGDDRSNVYLRLAGYGSGVTGINFGGTYSWEGAVNDHSRAFAGDLYVTYGKLWFMGTQAGKKLGFDLDAQIALQGTATIDFFTNYDMSKDSKAKLVGFSIGASSEVLTSANPNLTGFPSKAKGGGYASYFDWGGSGTVATFLDNTGQLFARNSNYYWNNGYTNNTIWRRFIGEVDGQTTTLDEKIDATKGVKTKDLSFTLQASITPTPNTLVPKTDGSGLMWYNNNSVGLELFTGTPFVYNVPSTITVNHVNVPASPDVPTYIQAIQDRLTQLSQPGVVMQKFTNWNIVTLDNLANSNVRVINNDLVNTYVQQYQNDSNPVDTLLESVHTNKILPRNSDWAIRFKIEIGSNGTPRFGVVGRVTNRKIGIYTGGTNSLTVADRYYLDGYREGDNTLILPSSPTSKRFIGSNASNTTYDIFLNNNQASVDCIILKCGDNILFQMAYAGVSHSEIYQASTVGSGDFGFCVSASKPYNGATGGYNIGTVSDIRYYIFP